MFRFDLLAYYYRYCYYKSMRTQHKNRLFGVIVFIFLAIFLSCSSYKPPRKRIEVDLHNKPVNLGIIEAQLNSMIAKAGMKKLDIAVEYYPVDDVVSLRFRLDLATYWQFWDEINRKAFVEALSAYKTDYEMRNLTNKNQRNKRAYGTLLSYTVYETASFTMPDFGYPNLELGYQFKSNAPYFTVTQRAAKSENPLSGADDAQSPNLFMYFTRAQADELAVLFDAITLRSVGSAPALSPDSGISSDSYFESD
jgi:hypothetical protein